MPVYRKELEGFRGQMYLSGFNTKQLLELSKGLKITLEKQVLLERGSCQQNDIITSKVHLNRLNRSVYPAPTTYRAKDGPAERK